MTSSAHAPQDPAAAQGPDPSGDPAPADVPGADGPPRLTGLVFHGPIGEARAARWVDRLAPVLAAAPDGGRVLDIGCGWGELMLRLLAAAPPARGTGLDLNTEDLARGRANAAARGLSARADFVEADATKADHEPADVVLCLGASQALADNLAEALAALRARVRPGGRVLLGEGFWEREPTPAELAASWPDAAATDHTDLATLVDTAVAAGFRPVWVESADRTEWDDFESGYLADTELWLATHPNHPSAPATRDRLDTHRSAWLRGYRTILGIAYLTLVPSL
ncbi:SAM-dependent methyltransferase [Streptomyces sp. NRRL F-5123]|uniref:SAM-dependent methyltransferase n=1 Tax=Streptomyces sp. NRRL F-5123 TaxID=1463856 RepID=UPI00099BDB51|nr:methyltransferase domain-containing protein [Streptomyces sp. NRRL F-5123]